MTSGIAFIGFGEAAQTFAGATGWTGPACAYDIKTLSAEQRDAKLADYERFGVSGCETSGDAVAEARSVLSLVTADQSLKAAECAARHLQTGGWFFDMNSVAPARKVAAAEAIEAAGARYADVAIMAPVMPASLKVPLLVSGPHAVGAADQLRVFGFKNVRTVGDKIGEASAIKMIRSVMTKGIEALTAECVLAASKAGVVEEVTSSLGGDWTARADYNLERMLVHGSRRAAEMEEVCATLEDLGVEPVMTRGTVFRQAELGTIGAGSVPDSFEEKLRLIASTRKADAA
ncbi:MAG: DUF1932 domain-containing protein [Henriciella sp.]|uniref:DUF1932 domain-containing protein n=1 Tax=Henriciella sp. TaxID=1968823 RepID=UPI003C751191